MTVATLTLAKLYESQNHLLDALIIYNQLRKDAKDLEIEMKIETLGKKLFKENSFKYNTLIDEIFSIEDKIFFQIYPKKQYENFSSLIGDSPEIEIDDFEQPENDSKDSQIKKFTDLMGNIKQDDLEDTLIAVFGKQKNLDDIKLSEVWETLVGNGYER
ncbi:MAG: hypothetical protein K8S23_09305 [Candidatus Cloacimonetes bacterium]|nr:hypothetical protein [Candidatus Cloacimonadota bacterium]